MHSYIYLSLSLSLSLPTYIYIYIYIDTHIKASSSPCIGPRTTGRWTSPASTPTAIRGAAGV